MRMNTSEGRRHYLKYYKIHILNQHTNISFILEWQRQFQITSHKITIILNEGFVIVFTFKLISCFIDDFTFKMKSQSSAYLLNGSDHIYWIFDLEGEMHSIWDFWISGLQECKNNGFVEVGQGGQEFSVGFKNFEKNSAGLPQPRSNTPWKFVGGVYRPPLRRQVFE